MTCNVAGQEGTTRNVIVNLVCEQTLKKMKKNNMCLSRLADWIC